MVKKKKAAKKAPPKKAAKKAAKRAAKKPAFDGAAARKAKAAKPRRSSEEQMELMPGTRYADLDRFCRNIGDNRDEVNQLKGEGKSLEVGALKAMRSHGVKAYKHAGVTLAIIPGDEKLLVKKDRQGAADGAPAPEPEPEPEGDAGGSTTGEGQDPQNIGEALTDRDDEENDDE